MVSSFRVPLPQRSALLQTSRHTARLTSPLKLDAATSISATIPPLPPAPTTNVVMRGITALYFAFACFGSALIVYPPLIGITLTSLFLDNTRRRWNDWVVAAWARFTLTFMRASVTVEGTENLPPHGEAVMFVPNHSSFLDIFALSGFLPRRFKYISKM